MRQRLNIEVTTTIDDEWISVQMPMELALETAIKNIVSKLTGEDWNKVLIKLEYDERV